MDITTAAPVEIDTALSEIYGRADQIWMSVVGVRKALQSTHKWNAQRAARNEFEAAERAESIAKQESRRDALIAEHEAVIAETVPYEEEFTRRGGWTRFFLVPGGHIHRSMACSTCNKNDKATSFGWLPEWSGQSEDEALEALVTESRKTILCTVCFPNAPVAWTVARPDPTVCPGSKTYDYEKHNGRYASCNHCGTYISITGTGLLRSHKKEA